MSSTSIFFFLTVSAVITAVTAAEFQVGGAVGWRLPATNETELYDVWASRRRFHVGDSLRFSYNNNSVAVVSKYGYYHCDSTNPIAFFNDGDTVIDLDNVGTMYFISGNTDQCKQGVKMIVNVMNTVPVRSLSPAVSPAPENSYYVASPSPSQVMSFGSSPDASPGPGSSDSVLVSVSVGVVWLGLGVTMLNV